MSRNENEFRSNFANHGVLPYPKDLLIDDFFCSLSPSHSISLSCEGFIYAAEVVDNKNGCVLLRYQGKEYVKHIIRTDRVYWRCRMSHKGCRARLTTRFINGRILTQKTADEIKHINHAR